MARNKDIVSALKKCFHLSLVQINKHLKFTIILNLNYLKYNYLNFNLNYRELSISPNPLTIRQIPEKRQYLVIWCS